MQNAENGVVWGTQGSLEILGNNTIQYSTCKFLLAFHSNNFPIVHMYEYSYYGRGRLM